MLFEQVEQLKNESIDGYQLLAKSVDFSYTNDYDLLIGLFVVSTAHLDLETFRTLKPIIENLKNGNDEYNYFYEIANGQYHYYTKNYNDSLVHYIKATEIAHELDKNHLIADSNRYLSIVYRKMGDVEQAIYYIENAIRVLTGVKNALVYANVYLTYGVILMDAQSFAHARRSFDSALEQFKTLNNYEKYLNYRILLFNMYELCEETGDYESANFYFSKAIIEIKEHHSLFDDMIHLSKSKICKRQGLYSEAIEHLENYIKDLNKHQVVDLNINKEEVKFNFEQISDLKIINRTLLNRMNQMFETIDSSDDTLISYELEERINNAIVKDFIKPYYQLKWHVKKQRFIGAEALIRWIDGEVSIPPNEFIYDAENSSIIMKMSEKIIRESFSFCRKVLDSYAKDFVVSINISPYQLANQELVKLFKNEMLLHNLEGHHIEIEITERSFLDQNPKILETLYALSDLGIGIALDDFGTGYSSLSCVNDFPIDVIKIDRSLISNIETDKKSYKLLAGIIRMMKELELVTVAEGVETKVQAEILKNLECDYIQGYYYARPEAESEALNLLRPHAFA